MRAPFAVFAADCPPQHAGSTGTHIHGFCSDTLTRQALRVVRAAAAAAPLLALAACATEPRERRVRAEFACEDGRRLRAVYFLDRGLAELRLSRKEVAEVPAIPGVPGRAYAGAGWELHGIGDSVTLTSPGAPSVRCTETR